MVTAAVIGSAVVGAAGSMAAANTAANATQNAANTAAQAQNNTLAMQQQQLQAQIALQQQALNQQTQLSAPYRSLGQSAIPQLEGALGINPQPVVNQAPPLNGAPGQPQQAYTPPQQQQQGVGPLGGGGVPIGNPTLSGGLGAYSGGALALPSTSGGPAGGQVQISPTGQAIPTMGQPQQQSMYNPPAATTNGIPSYSGVLQGYQNLLGNLYQAQGLNANGTMGANGPNTQAMTDALRNSPGYQFQLQQGNQNAVNQASAMGMGLSGNTLQGLDQFGQGLADTTYQQYLGNLNNTLGAYQGYVGDYQNYLGNLMNSIGMGQASAANQAANIGQSASNMGAAYQNAGAQSAAANNQLGNIAVNQGNTLAGINANEIAGITKSIGNVGNYYTTQNTLNALNNPNGQSLYYSPSPSYTSDPSTIDAGGGYTFNTP